MATTLTTTTSTVTQAIELDTEAQALVNELRTLRDQSTALEKQKAVIRDQLLEVLGDAEVGIVDGVVRLRQREEARRSIDYKTLQELYVEVYEQVVSTNTFTKLDIK